MVVAKTIRRRPELIQLPSVPTVVKISEVPTGTVLLRINLPFTLRHLAKAGVQKAWAYIATGKSLMTLLGEDTALIREMKESLEKKIAQKYPMFRRHVRIQMMCQIRWGTHYSTGGTKSRQQPSLQYIADVPKLQADLEECGFSSIPILAFQIMVNEPPMVMTFLRHMQYKGFIASQFGNKLYDAYSEDTLRTLIVNNLVLQKLNCHICKTNRATGIFETCLIDKGESEE